MSELDNQYQDVVANAQRTTVLFTDRLEQRNFSEP
nr:hypothetical protein [Faecalibacterium sp.]